MANQVTHASIVRTYMQGRNRWTRIALPTWVFSLLDLDKSSPQYVLLHANEFDNSVTIRASTLAERTVSTHLISYLNGLWGEPTANQLKIQSELEEFHSWNPARLTPKDPDNPRRGLLLIEYPFSRLTQRENGIYSSLPDDLWFTYVDLRKLNMSIASSIKFTRKCTELQLLETVSIHISGRGRPIKQFRKRKDFPREIPWTAIHKGKNWE